MGNSEIKALLDTNALLLIADGIRVLDNIESLLDKKVDFLCPESVINELKRMAYSRGEGWRKAEWVLSVIDKICRQIPSLAESADEDILQLSESFQKRGYGVVVSTNDRELRRKLKLRGIPTVYLLESEMIMDTDYEA